MTGTLVGPLFSDHPVERQLLGSGGMSATYTTAESLPPTGRLFTINYQFDPAPVPEPATLALVGSGVALPIALKRRRRAAGSDQYHT
jgi:hypothetical protein